MDAENTVPRQPIWPPVKMSIYNQYALRVILNLHTCISPMQFILFLTPFFSPDFHLLVFLLIM